LNPNSLISWNKLKTFKGFGDDRLQVASEAFIAACSQSIAKWTGLRFVYGNYTEYHDGTRGQIVSPRETPVSSDLKVWVDCSRKFEDASLLDDYTILNKKLYSKRFSLFGSNVIKLSYNGGYVVPKYEQSNEPPDPQNGDYWQDTSEWALKMWDGATWSASELPVMPDDIQMAVTAMFDWQYNRIKSGQTGVKTKAIEAGMTSWETEIPKSIKEKLRRYKRYPL